MQLYACAITGHRPEKLHLGSENSPATVKLKQAIHSQFVNLYHQGVRHFYLGGALGVDLWAGEILVCMRDRENYSDLKLFLALPFPGYEQGWQKSSQERLENLRTVCDQATFVCTGERAPALCYRERNYYLVDHADCLLAVYDVNLFRSGTGMTVRYGEKKGIPIFIIRPQDYRRKV